jgi:hypothetical protein
MCNPMAVRCAEQESPGLWGSLFNTLRGTYEAIACETVVLDVAPPFKYNNPLLE